MKRILAILFLLSLSSCFVPQRPGYIDYRERRMLDWDPIYYVPGFYDPFLYRTPRPTIIYRDRYVPVPRTPQQPRVENVRPYVPQQPQSPRGGSAPIRTFPKKEESKDK